MFPEYRHLITTLKHSDQHFTRLFDRHNDLDQQIKRMEDGVERASSVEIENLKKEKLRVKDELYVLLKRASGH